MRGFWAVFTKEILHMQRDPVILFFALAIPCIQLTLFGFAFDFDVRHVASASVDYSNSRESRAFIQSLRNTQYCDFKFSFSDRKQVYDALRRGTVKVGVIIAPDFARTRNAQVLVDGSDSQVASRIMSAVKMLGTIGAASSAQNAYNVHTVLLYNPSGLTARFIIPGLIGVIMQIITIVLTCLSIVKERENGNLEQLMVSPIGRWGLMLGKLSPYGILGLAEMFIILYFSWLLFDVVPAGSIATLLFLTVPFLMATLAIGLFISTICQNQSQAMLAVIITILPSVLLSGFIFPLETIPLPLYVISQIIPVTHYMQVLRGVIIRGAELADLYTQMIVLWSMAGFLITVSSLRFRKSTD
ncbi:MAG: ABC transporter permease [bacterium]|nr:ABC transporter permease [bacterium]